MLREKIDFLKTLRIFSALNDVQLERIALISEAYNVKDRAVLAYQRDVANSLYIVVEGRISAYQMQDGIEVKVDEYNPGEYFDEQWLFGEDVHPATIRAEGDGRLYMIREEDFELFVEDFPEAVLDMPEFVWDELDHTRSSPAAPDVYRKLELLPGENVLYESHRTWLLLVTGLFGPILALLFGPLVMWLLVGYLLKLSLLYIAIAIGVALIPGAVLTLWRYLDWRNDYLIITNYHLVHREFQLATFESAIIKIPHDQVQSISVLRAGIIPSLLGVGTVRVTTASAGDGLNFDLIQNPDEAEATLNEARQRTERLDRSRERTAVRQAIEGHFNVIDDLTPFDEGEQIAARQSDLPDTRVDPGRKADFETITYRRHWMILLKSTARQWLAVVTVLALMAFSLTTFPSFWLPVVIVGLLLLLGLFGWIYYEFEDWKNDLFQLTSTMVVDIDRLPFRLDEDRKTADLQNVQNVQVSRPNFVATIFGFGDVTIDTAGANAQIVFEDVANPNRVQSDIFARRTQILRRQRMTDAVTRRQEMLLMLDEYHQLSEQRKIPRMTPFFEDERPSEPDNQA